MVVCLEERHNSLSTIWQVYDDLIEQILEAEIRFLPIYYEG